MEMELLVPRACTGRGRDYERDPPTVGPSGFAKAQAAMSASPRPFPVHFALGNWLFADVAFAQGGKPSGQVHPDMQEVDDDHSVRAGNENHIMLARPGIAQVFR